MKSWSSSRVIEGNVQGASDFYMILQHKCLVTLKRFTHGMLQNSTSKGSGHYLWQQGDCGIKGGKNLSASTPMCITQCTAAYTYAYTIVYAVYTNAHTSVHLCGAPLVLVITFWSPILQLSYVILFISLSFSIVFLYISKVMTNSKTEPPMLIPKCTLAYTYSYNSAWLRIELPPKCTTWRSPSWMNLSKWLRAVSVYGSE